MVFVVLQWNDHSPRDHQSVENLVESEVDNVVQPEDCRGGQDGGVDDIDGEEEEGEAEEKACQEVVQLLAKLVLTDLKRDQVMRKREFSLKVIRFLLYLLRIKDQG